MAGLAQVDGGVLQLLRDGVGDRPFAHGRVGLALGLHYQRGDARHVGSGGGSAEKQTERRNGIHYAESPCAGDHHAVDAHKVGLVPGLPVWEVDFNRTPVTEKLRLVVAGVGGIYGADRQQPRHGFMSDNAALFDSVLQDIAVNNEQFQLPGVAGEFPNVDVRCRVVERRGVNALVGVVVAILLPVASFAHIVL